MYVTNPDSVNKSKCRCNKLAGEWLIRNGVPLFSISGWEYIFIKTNLLDKKISEMPFGIKFFGGIKYE